MWGVLRETEGERAGRTLAWVHVVPVLFLLNVFPPAFSLCGCLGFVEKAFLCVRGLTRSLLEWFLDNFL